MPKRVIETCKDRLHTQATLCLKLGISFLTFDRWTDPDRTTDFKPEFFEAVTLAVTIMHAKWEEEGINNLYDAGEPDADSEGKIRWTKFNEKLYLKIMERYYGYVSRNSTDIKADITTMDDAERRALIEKYKASY
jgi:hypothetical protein